MLTYTLTTIASTMVVIGLPSVMWHSFKECLHMDQMYLEDNKSRLSLPNNRPEWSD